MQRFYGEKRDEYGRAEAGASVSVYDTGTSNLSVIYTASDPLTTPSSAIPNPLTTDANGLYGFAAPTGVYDIVIHGSGAVEYKNKVAMFDQTTSSTTGAGGSNTQVQYNNGGVLTGSSALTTDGTNLTVGGYESVEAVRFNTSTPDTSNVDGNTYWDSTNKTLTTVIDSANGTKLQHGQEEYIRCINDDSVKILNGKVVYISGSYLNEPTVLLAKADALATCWRTIGIATQDIEVGASGFVTTFGVVHDLDTSSYYADGVPLFLSASTAGALTDAAPSSPNYVVQVGTVVGLGVSGAVLVAPTKVVAADTSLTANSNIIAPSQRAVKAYSDAFASSLASTASAALGAGLVGQGIKTYPVDTVGGAAFTTIFGDGVTDKSSELTTANSLGYPIRIKGVLVVGSATTITVPILPTLNQIFSSGSLVTINNGLPVYPEWWGAEADSGLTDCTAAFSGAVESLKSVGGVVRISPNPNAYYGLASVVAKIGDAYSNITLEGAGYNSWIKHTTNIAISTPSSTGNIILFMGDSAYSLKNPCFKNFRISGNSSTTDYGVLIGARNSDGATWMNMYGDTTRGEGFATAGPSNDKNIMCHGCRLTDVGGYGAGSDERAAYNLNGLNVQVIGNYAKTVGSFVESSGGRIVVSNNLFEYSSGYGVLVLSTFSPGYGDAIVSGNSIRYANYAITIGEHSGTPGSIGRSLVGGNVITNCNTGVISRSDNSKNITTIQNNYFCDVADNSNGSAVHVETGVAIVKGNVFDQGTTPWQYVVRCAVSTVTTINNFFTGYLATVSYIYGESGVSPESIGNVFRSITYSASTRYRSAIGTYSLDNYSGIDNSNTVISIIEPKVIYSGAAPTRDTWLVSDRIIRYPQAIGSPKAWVCTTAGGGYSTTRANTTAYAQGVFVLWSTGTTVWECTIAGTSSGSAPSIIGKVVGDTVVDGGVTWTMRDLTSAVFTSEGNL